MKANIEMPLSINDESNIESELLSGVFIFKQSYGMNPHVILVSWLLYNCICDNNKFIKKADSSDTGWFCGIRIEIDDELFGLDACMMYYSYDKISV